MVVCLDIEAALAPHVHAHLSTTCKWVKVAIISRKDHGTYRTRWCPSCPEAEILSQIQAFIKFDSTMIRYSGGTYLMGMDIDILGLSYEQTAQGAALLRLVVGARGITPQKIRLEMLHKTDGV
jgi:hypothetical protein